jgi:hypothetical protein
MIKKGSKEGKTTVNQVFRPIDAASKVSLGKISMDKHSIIAAIENKIFILFTPAFQIIFKVETTAN